MSSRNEDKIFKNISNEDARILLEIIDVDTIKLKIWTKELRLLDPKDYIPDIILELDFENLIIELQSTKVDEEFSKRALTYVAVSNREKDNEKQVKLIVLSTAEESKIKEYNFNDESVFTYHIISLKDLNENEIIETFESKFKEGKTLTAKEIILYALVPMVVEKDMENYITRVIHNLLQLSDVKNSVKNLAYGIEWLIVDKFVKNEITRQLLCDTLGDRMSLLYEYVERKEEKAKLEGMKNIIEPLINSGLSLIEISQRLNKPVEEIQKILE